MRIFSLAFVISIATFVVGCGSDEPAPVTCPPGAESVSTAHCGVPGKRPCAPRVRAFVNEHHYVVIEVLRDRMRVCPKRPDGTLLEPCPTIALRK